jgi:hypothetical protein
MSPAILIGQRYDICWDFIVSFYALSGIKINRDAYRNSELFTRIEEPTDGCVAILGAYALGDHCGIFHSGKIYHHTLGLGVVMTRPNQFQKRSYHEYRP